MPDIDYKLLKALSAVVQEGGFEKASRLLHISQSAVSQRIKQLEEQIGQVLLTRTSPPHPTVFGRQIIKHYHQVKLLETDLFDSIEVGPRDGFVTFPIGINVDSLATWFLAAMGAFLKAERVLLDLVVDDQAHTHQLMLDGKVGGCISSRAEPMPGCRVAYLGSINYHLLGTPQFAREWLSGGLSLETVGRAPILVYNRKDDSHKKLIEIALGKVPAQLTVHYFPAVERFIDFIASGLACGMCDITADETCMRMLTEGSLVDLAPPHHVKLKLYWHCWNLNSSLLDRFSAMLVEKTRKILLD